MSSTSRSEVWANRWAWAAAAVEDVRGRLGPQLQHLIGGGSAEVSVVLYGPTHVGKSTLLLTLLGVAEPHRSTVSDVLGSRGSGRSTTAAPIRYRWSPFADDWEFGDDGPAQRCTEDEVRERLADLRRGLGTTRPGSGTRPVTVGLPTRYRGSTSAVVPHVIDLPGIDGAEDVERAAVRRMVQHHVPLADLVVLVVDASRMSSLAAALERPELDWLAWPQRYRLVMSYCVTHAYGSHRDLRDRTEPIAVRELRAVAARELDTFLPPGRLDEPGAREQLEAILYPIEFGKSWAKDATERERVVFGPAVGELIDELDGQIDLAAVDESRYVALPRAAQAVRAHNERRRDEIMERVEGRRADREKVEEQLERLDKVVQDATRSLGHAERLHQLADDCSAELAAVAVRPAEPREPADEGGCRLDEQRVVVRAAVRAATDQWRRGAAARLSAAARSPLPTVLVADSAAARALDEAHEGDRPCWDGRPLRFMLMRCHERLASRWTCLRDDLTGQLRSAAGSWIARTRDQLPPLAAARGRLTVAQGAADRARRDLEAVDEQLSALDAELAVHAADAERSERTAGAIVAELDRHWQRHVDDLYRRLARSTDPEEQENLTLAVMLAHHLRDTIGDG